MKGGIFRKLYMKARLYFSGLDFPIEDEVFDCRKGEFQGAIAQSREDDKLQIVHVKTGEGTFSAFIYNISINRIIGKAGKQLTQDLLRIFKSGFCLDGEIATITKDEDGYFSCVIRIFSKTSYMIPYLADLKYLTAENNE